MQVFPDSAHQAELEKHQGHIRQDTKFPFHGANGRLFYDLHDKNWIPHNGINNPSNCKVDTKYKGYQEKMFFDWKIQFEKVQLFKLIKESDSLEKTSKDIAILQHAHKQPFGFPNKPAQVAKLHSRMIKFHQKCFKESIQFEDVSPDQIRHTNHKFGDFHNIENKSTRFQIYPETELMHANTTSRFTKHNIQKILSISKTV